MLHRYVPHTNRALRSFNMYLNVRKPPLRSKFYWNPLSFFFPRPNEPSSASSASPPRPPSAPGTRSRSASMTRPMQTIPPAKCPRGELIFSSRVDKNFCESYERYRAAFERKREEKLYLEWKKTWCGKLMFWQRPPTAAAAQQQPPLLSRTASTSSHGRGSRSGTPPTALNSSQGVIVMKERDRSRSRSPMSPSRERTPRRDRVDALIELDTSLRTVVLERNFGQVGVLGDR